MNPKNANGLTSLMIKYLLYPEERERDPQLVFLKKILPTLNQSNLDFSWNNSFYEDSSSSDGEISGMNSPLRETESPISEKEMEDVDRYLNYEDDIPSTPDGQTQPMSPSLIDSPQDLSDAR